MSQSPVKIIKAMPLECGEYGCPTDAGRVEFRSDGEVTFVFSCRHKYSRGPWEAHYRRVAFTDLAKEAIRRDPTWLAKFVESLGLTPEPDAVV